jgi:hypothetical protein
VNEAQLAVRQQEEKDGLLRDLESLRAAVYNSQSQVVDNTPSK